jgi:hypothetical protein
MRDLIGTIHPHSTYTDISQFSLAFSEFVASVGKNQLNPLSINQTEKLLDPFSHSKVVKDLAN